MELNHIISELSVTEKVTDLTFILLGGYLSAQFIKNVLFKQKKKKNKI
jgi:hypothetical protein